MKHRLFTIFALVFILTCQSSQPETTRNLPAGIKGKRAFSILVLPIEVQGNSQDLQKYSSAIKEMTEAYLLQASGIHPVTDYKYLLDTFSQPLTKEMALKTGANFTLQIRLSEINNRYNCTIQLNDLNTGSSKSVDLTPAPASSLGNLPADIFFELQSLKIKQSGETDDAFLSISGQSEIYQRFKPSINPFRNYAYGIYYKDKNVNEAIRYFNKALELEPYFIEAETARFEALYSSSPWIQANFARANRASFQLLRYNKLDPVQTAVFFQKMGMEALRHNRSVASQWLERSNQLLLIGNSRDSIQFALNHALLGMIHLYYEKYEPARQKLRVAEGILNRNHLLYTLTGTQTVLNLYSVEKLQNNQKAAIRYREILQNQREILNPIKEVDLLIRYNMAVTDYITADYRPALNEFMEIHKELISSGNTNTRININNLLNINASQIYMREYRDSIHTAKSIASHAKNTGLHNHPAYKYSVYNHSYALNQLGRNGDAARLRLSMGYSAYAPNRPLYESYVSIFEVPERSRLFHTRAEEQKVASYTGAFRIENHTQRVRARTYPGRQDDTNMLLRDILDERKSYPELDRLRENWLVNKSDIEGQGILFIDIGPGLANLQWPAITTQSIAQDFRRMDVVAWDLPQQVYLYKNTVAAFKKREIRAKKNIYIVGANGKEPLSEVFSETDRWLLHDRSPLSYSNGRPVIIRIANSIDIYFPYSEIERVLENMASDLKENPLLICFNRSILLKKAGETKFSVIGYVSVRGFHHNREILNRYGEPPYTLVSNLDFNDQ